MNVGYQGNDLSLSSENSKLKTVNEPLIDKNGKELALTHEGAIIVRKLVVLDLEIAKGGKLAIGKDAKIELPVGSNQLFGKASVPQGLTYQIVENSAVRSTSEVILTLKSSPPDGLSHAVTNIKEGQFTIQLSRGAPYALEFVYWILDTFDVSGSLSTGSSVSGGNATSTVQ